MKIKKLLYTCMLFFMLFAPSCSDSFLDMKNYGAYDDFNSESKVNWYLATLYHMYFNGFVRPNGFQAIAAYNQDWSYATSEQWGIKDKIDPNKNFSTLDDISNGDNSSFLFNSYFGQKLPTGTAPNQAYTRIRYCNIMIRDIDGSNVSADTKRYAKGQALFLRAMQMHDLVRIYGPTPIVTTVLNAEASGDKLPRASVTECMKQIVQDLKEAAELLPPVWDAANYGRPTSESALALKSRVLLTYASPIFNKDWDNPQNDRWHKALIAAQEAVDLIQNNGNGCTDAKGWGTMLAKDDNAFNKEALFVKLLTDDNATSGERNPWEGDIRLSSQGGRGKAVPMELIDMFPLADGTRPKAGNRIADGNTRFIENRDPRFYQTFGFSGMLWEYTGTSSKIDAEPVVWAYRWRRSATEESFSYSQSNNVASPVFVRKMTNPNTVADENFTRCGTEINEYRYGELLLNLAECYAATGDIENCKNTLAKLRMRVGIPEGSQFYGLNETVRDRHSALEACLYERQIELAFEGKRFWDIWRWLLYDGGQGEGLKLSTINTCTALGIPQLNGTSRTSIYLDVKTGTYTPGGTDALIDRRAGISVDINGADFQTKIKELADFYETNFEFGDPTLPADRDSNDEAATILWRSNYYINGLSKTILDSNGWLGQTIGWFDQNGVPGTINWQDDESFPNEDIAQNSPN